jgi:hypothetical protein
LRLHRTGRPNFARRLIACRSHFVVVIEDRSGRTPIGTVVPFASAAAGEQ